ncbi:MAG: glycosyltransferase [Lentimicrobiaceae bacterium]|nr:glycosyltransferase [Lentimicrobiaceae bacterium]
MLFDIELSDPLVMGIALVFSFSFLVQLFYYWFFFSRLAFHRQKPFQSTDHQVSVVICARNEYYNLERNLPIILEQDYPDFEVVVVNDCSDDDTFYLLNDMAEKYKNLKIVNINQTLNFFSGKKFPLSIGIKSAKNELLLLTDADCNPRSRQWIRQMQSQFDNKTEIVLGYGGYECIKGLLNKLIRYDTLQVAMQYLSLAKAGLPYMGVGRNLAYRKSLFYKNNGFISHYRIQSGDDDLFINRVAHRKNTRVEVSLHSHTISVAKTSFRDWMRQKKRHLSTGRYYKTRHKIVLGLFSSTRFLFFLTLAWLLCSGFNYYVVLLALLLRMISQLIITRHCMKQLSEKQFLFLTPIFEIFLFFTNATAGFLTIFSRKQVWK